MATEKMSAIRLRQLRAEHGYTQEFVGDRVGVKNKAVSMWETGERTPDRNQLVKLSRLYNVSMEYILGESNDRTKNPSSDNPGTIDDMLYLLNDKLEVPLSGERIEEAKRFLRYLEHEQRKEQKKEQG